MPHLTFRQRNCSSNRSGQTLVEYALILAFISIVAIAVMKNLSTQVKGTFSTVTSQLSSATTAGAPAGGGAPPAGG